MSAVLAFASPLLAAAEGGGGFNPLEVNFGLSFWTWVIFLLALPFMWKVVFGPITRALMERDERAEGAIAKAEEAQAGAEKARQEAEQQLTAAREEAQRQVRDAMARAEAQQKELLAKAQAEAERERARALADIEAERRRAIAEIRDTVVDISLQAAGQLLQREVKDDDQRKFVSGFIGDLSNRN